MDWPNWWNGISIVFRSRGRGFSFTRENFIINDYRFPSYGLISSRSSRRMDWMLSGKLWLYYRAWSSTNNVLTASTFSGATTHPVRGFTTSRREQRIFRRSSIMRNKPAYMSSPVLVSCAIITVFGVPPTIPRSIRQRRNECWWFRSLDFWWKWWEIPHLGWNVSSSLDSMGPASERDFGEEPNHQWR